jgi:hypothetical protein
MEEEPSWVARMDRCVCVFVCLHVCLCACERRRVGEGWRKREERGKRSACMISIHVCRHTYIHQTHIYTLMCIHVCMHTHTDEHTCMHVHAHPPTHADTDTHTYRHTHTDTHTHQNLKETKL